MSLPANQLFMPLHKWPFPIQDAGGVLPPHDGTTEDVLRRWFYLMRYWELAVSGTYTIVRPGIGTFLTTFSGSQVIPAQKIAISGDEEAFESDELILERDIWKGVSLLEAHTYGCDVEAAAYAQLGHGWGVTSQTTFDREEGDDDVYDPVVVGSVNVFADSFSIVRDPSDHEKLYPYLRLHLNPVYAQAVVTNHYSYESGKTVVGSFTVDGFYAMDIVVSGTLTPGASYSGDIAATLTPKSSGAYWPWGKLADGTDPKWNADTGEKIGSW